MILISGVKIVANFSSLSIDELVNLLWKDSKENPPDSIVPENVILFRTKKRVALSKSVNVLTSIWANLAKSNFPSW